MWAQKLLLGVSTTKADSTTPGISSSARNVLLPNWVQEIYDSIRGATNMKKQLIISRHKIALHCIKHARKIYQTQL
jgi:hypothetical protein